MADSFQTQYTGLHAKSHNMAHVFKSAGVPNDLVRKETLLVAGLETYAYYHQHEANPFAGVNKKSCQNLKILYLLHGRTSSAAILEELAHDLITKYYNKQSDKDVEPILVITFDFRNHGKRLLSEHNQQSWNKGNITHAADMLSYIDGGVEELKTIHDYLPSFIPGLEYFKPRYIVSGVSMGGHTTIRAVVKHPGVFDGAVPIVGCFDLTSLLLNRLGNFKDAGQHSLYSESYSDLKKDFDTAKFPKPLFDIVAKNDALVAHTYDTRKLKTFALFGDHDSVVLMDYSRAFLNRYDIRIVPRNELNTKSQFQAVEYNAEHEVTEEMTDDLSQWLIEF